MAVIPTSTSTSRHALFIFLIWSASLVSTCRSFLPASSSANNKNAVGRNSRSSLSLLSAMPAPTIDETSTTEETTTEKKTSLSSSLSLSSLFPNDRQILSFVEPQTNVTVMLIGSMHYNPASIKLVENTLDDLGQTNKLGSVIIESCDIRWNKTQELIEKKRTKTDDDDDNEDDDDDDEITTVTQSNDKDFLGNEMRAAWEIASLYQRPTVLGDQRINITVDALKASLKETAIDLISGPAGWKRSKDEIVESWERTIPVRGKSIDDDEGYQYLNAFAFFDPRLLISLPVSLVKYPLSFLVKDPIPVGSFFIIIAALNYYGGDGSAGAVDVGDAIQNLFVAKEYPWTDYVVSFVVAVLETVVFARLLLKPLLAERNEILAKSVLDQCKLYSTTSTTTNTNKNNGNGNNIFGSWLERLFSSSAAAPASSTSQLIADSDLDVVYVPGSDPVTMMKTATTATAMTTRSSSSSDENEGKIVVAVLGMAHCNGVMKLLKEQRV